MTRKMLAKKISVLLAHALGAWALCAATIWVAMRLVPRTAALIIHAASAPIFFALVSWNYFKRYHYTSAIQTAAFFALTVVSLDFFLVALLIHRSLTMLASLLGTWIPLVLIFASTFLAGRWWEASAEEGTDAS